MADRATPRDTIAAFEAGLKKLVAVPKRSLDEKVKAFKQRRKISGRRRQST